MITTVCSYATSILAAYLACMGLSLQPSPSQQEEELAPQVVCRGIAVTSTTVDYIVLIGRNADIHLHGRLALNGADPHSGCISRLFGSLGAQGGRHLPRFLLLVLQP